MKRLPVFLKQYFWDVDFKNINPDESGIYITERLLEFGNIKAVNWLLKTYGEDLIKEVVRTRRGISPKTGNFWGDMLNIHKFQIPSLRNSLPNSSSSVWDYQLK